MYSVEISCSDGRPVIVGEIKEIRMFYGSELKQTFTVNEFSSFITTSGYSYTFTGTKQIFSVAGDKINNVFFYIPQEINY